MRGFLDVDCGQDIGLAGVNGGGALDGFAVVKMMWFGRATSSRNHLGKPGRPLWPSAGCCASSSAVHHTTLRRLALPAADQWQDAGLGGAAGWRAEQGGLGAGGWVLIEGRIGLQRPSGKRWQLSK